MGQPVASHERNAYWTGRADQLYQAKKYRECIVACQAGLKRTPHEIKLHDFCALSYLQTNQDQKAIESYAQILKFSPLHCLANLNIAKIHFKHQAHELALPFLKKCQTAAEQPELVHLLTGRCHETMGAYAEAVNSYAELLSIDPHNVTAYVRMATSLNLLKQTQGAVDLLDMAIKLIPDSNDLLFCKALLLMERGLNVSALEAFEALHANGKATAHQLCGHAEVLCRMKKMDAAIEKYEEALQLEPKRVTALINYGNLLSRLKRMDEAIDKFEMVLTIDPKNSMALGNISTAMLIKRDLNKAWEYAERACEVNPSASGSFLYTMCFHCDWAKYDATLDVLKNDEKCEYSGPFVPIIFSNDAEVHLKYNQSWAKKVTATGILGPLKKYQHHSKIKIGYYSCDFFNHATAMLIEGMLKAHNRDKFELHAFSLDVSRQDEYTERLRLLFDHYHEVYHYSDRAVVNLSRELEIDIAIDLKGYTEGSRPTIFAERAAPVQINFLGYPGTMGASFIDYIVADHTLITPDNQEFFTEEVIYMPDCYQPNNNGRPKPDLTQARPSDLPENKFVFCSFNNAYKITPSQFKLWMRILRQAPNSVFWMLKSTERAQSNLLRYAAEEGIDPNRIIFASFLPEAQHLTRLSHADLFLDTFPCNAHTTASDALWAGVPLVTRAGQTFASRVASSLLHATGLAELTVHNEEDYEALALRIYNDATLLRSLKNRVKHGIDNGPLYDTPLFTRNFETAIEKIYQG
ncbi:hypothetical protein B9Z45_07865 [Limnohabitans sp. 2KL-17]|uniref:tetratricopeptide repeat protein n=1 Tax=Limnohabitans sp. 2KL-17 TaxID=1100704 RepID=UPI000D334080|nr:tetratricopeptide repeat protein [Limnohabitans sp. 2KL-17]PUE57996.1 hypothetical protein B9Z45_07865 [Limnohabitans sp. 2KL-17]